MSIESIGNEDLQVGDVSESAESAVDAGQAQLSAEDAAATPQGDATGEAPAADAWTPPTREQFEAMKKHAELGQKYAPYSQHFDQMLQQAFQPQRQQAAPAPKPQGGEWVNPIDDIAGYGQFWSTVGKDPSSFRKVLRAEAEAVGKPHFERLQAFEEKIGSLEQLAHALEWHARQAPFRFQVNKDNEAFHEEAIKALKDGKVSTIEAAYDHVRKDAEIKKLKADIAAAKAQGQPGAAKPASKKAVPNAASAARPSAAPKGKGVAPAETKFDPKYSRNTGRHAVDIAMAQLAAEG